MIWASQTSVYYMIGLTDVDRSSHLMILGLTNWPELLDKIHSTSDRVRAARAPKLVEKSRTLTGDLGDAGDHSYGSIYCN
ncbi:hypothetical protein ZOSMA_440G00020 [Zostera marina]|uniref:Uncharacterized protein n=1 Tax=Zostera marina TaxID=29655 RepID=A0A0K9P174_ZOSMR|nr:hypothetical protein ZOSMA_440G00020 [Zostera marina]